jgi:hypothetical protein
MSSDGDSAEDRLYGYGRDEYIRFPEPDKWEKDGWEQRWHHSTACTGCGTDINTDDIWVSVDYHDAGCDNAYCDTCWEIFWEERDRFCQACSSESNDPAKAVTNNALCARHRDETFTFEEGCPICYQGGFVQSFPDRYCNNAWMDCCPSCALNFRATSDEEEESDEDHPAHQHQWRPYEPEAAKMGALAPYRPAAPAARAPRAETAPHDNRARNLRDMARIRKAFPRYCTHHLFHHHVLGRKHGCNLGDEPSCTTRGRTFLHERPRGFDEWAETLEVRQ